MVVLPVPAGPLTTQHVRVVRMVLLSIALRDLAGAGRLSDGVGGLVGVFFDADDPDDAGDDVGDDVGDDSDAGDAGDDVGDDSDGDNNDNDDTVVFISIRLFVGHRLCH